MYRQVLSSASRPPLRSLRPSSARVDLFRRFASKASPADKPRSWKSSALRWGLAAGAIYFYNTSPIFAEGPAAQQVSAPASFEDRDLPTVDSVIEQKRQELNSKLQKSQNNKQARAAEPQGLQIQKTDEPVEQPSIAATPESPEEEGGQQAAFNPETGEINWDCPCLGGMAHGPCGEEFKTAFSCFVYSEEEPKGMDCIDKFQGMQDCFRKYPEVYGAELADEEDLEGDDNVPEPLPGKGSHEPPVTEHQRTRTGTPMSDAQPDMSEVENLPGVRPVEEGITMKWEDARESNKEVEDEKK